MTFRRRDVAVRAAASVLSEDSARRHRRHARWRGPRLRTNIVTDSSVSFGRRRGDTSQSAVVVAPQGATTILSLATGVSVVMAAIAEFVVPAEEFALRETLECRPNLVCEVERVVAHDTAHIIPFIWASGGNLDGLTEVLTTDPSVNDIELLSETDDERLYRLSWTDEARVIGHMVIECEATVHRAVAAEGQWTLRVLFPDRSTISAVDEFAHEHGLSLDLRKLYEVDSAERARFDLSEDQQEALIEGYEQGYYEVPRDIDMSALAETLDISHQALSERLRRATGSLIETTLSVDETEDE
jgi:predicted DNA binding protein